MDEIKIPSIKDPDLLSDKEVEQLLPCLDELIAWAKQVQEFALGEALRGKHYNGYKIVEGRSIRKFSDEDKAVDALRGAGYSDEMLYERKLLSMSGLEALCGKKRFATVVGALVVKPKGKPALVPESDKRPEYDASTAADDFADDNPLI